MAQHKKNYVEQIGFDTVIKKDADYTDTLALIVYAVNKHSKDAFVKSIAEKLYSPDRETFIRNLFDFYCRNIKYVLDNAKIEKVYTPARTMAEGEGDCKKAATFLSSVLVAAGIEPVLKHVFYSGTTNYSHIYVIVPNPDIDHYITLDPTNDCRYNKEVNYKSGTLYFLNGKKMDLHYMGNPAPGQNTSSSLPFSGEILTGCDEMITGLEDIGDELMGKRSDRKARRAVKQKAKTQRKVNKQAAKTTRKTTRQNAKQARQVHRQDSRAQRQATRQQNRAVQADAPEQEQYEEPATQQTAPQEQYYEEPAQQEVEQDYSEPATQDFSEAQDTYIEEETTAPYDEDLNIYGPQSTQAIVVNALTKSKPSLAKHLTQIPLQNQRGSFLALVENNVDGIATNLAKVLGTNPASLDPVWKMVGGDSNGLKASVIKGASQPITKSSNAISGPDYISFIGAPKKFNVRNVLKGSAGVLRAIAPLSNAIVPGLGNVLIRLSDKAAFVESRSPNKKGGKLVPPPPLPSDPNGYQVPIPGSVPQGNSFVGSIGGMIFKSVLMLQYFIVPEFNINDQTASQLGTIAIIAPLTYWAVKKIKQKWQRSLSI